MLHCRCIAILELSVILQGGVVLLFGLLPLKKHIARYALFGNSCVQETFCGMEAKSLQCMHAYSASLYRNNSVAWSVDLDSQASTRPLVLSKRLMREGFCTDKLTTSR